MKHPMSMCTLFKILHSKTKMFPGDEHIICSKIFVSDSVLYITPSMKIIKKFELIFLSKSPLFFLDSVLPTS